MRQYLKIPDILDGEDKEEKHKINRIYIYIYIRSYKTRRRKVQLIYRVEESRKDIAFMNQLNENQQTGKQGERKKRERNSVNCAKQGWPKNKDAPK